MVDRRILCEDKGHKVKWSKQKLKKQVYWTLRDVGSLWIRPWTIYQMNHRLLEERPGCSVLLQNGCWRQCGQPGEQGPGMKQLWDYWKEEQNNLFSRSPEDRKKNSAFKLQEGRIKTDTVKNVLSARRVKPWNSLSGNWCCLLLTGCKNRLHKHARNGFGLLDLFLGQTQR